MDALSQLGSAIQSGIKLRGGNPEPLVPTRDKIEDVLLMAGEVTYIGGFWLWWVDSVYPTEEDLCVHNTSAR